MEKIPAAIIGLGRIASLLEDDSKREKPCTHAGAITLNAGLKLTGGCDTKEERRKLFAGRWGVPVYEDAGEMIRAHAPKILVIATHPDSHYHYCRFAASYSVPVVICEKPLADTLHAARKIALLARSTVKSRITIITNHERRYSADYIKAKEILAGNKLGAILSVRAALYMGKDQRLIDVLWHDGTHLVDAIMFLTGALLKHRKYLGAKLNEVAGTAWLFGELVPAKTQAELKSTSIPVLIEIGSKRDYILFEIEFSCERGKLRIGNGVFEVWESGECPYAEKFRSLKLKGEITSRSFEGKTGYFSNMIADAAACVIEGDRQPKSSAADGFAVIKYLHSVKAWLSGY